MHSRPIRGWQPATFSSTMAPAAAWASDLQIGTATLNTIEAMHGKSFALVAGAVAHYGAATVWVARARGEAEAKSMTAAMKDRIAAGRSPFMPTGTRQAGGRTVYTLIGMGQAHFYWQAGDKVIWLAAAPAEAAGALQELVRAIH